MQFGGNFMSRLMISAALLALIATGCEEQHCTVQPTASNHSSTQNKPIVSIVPVIDNTKNDYAWNISDELTHSINNRLAQLNHVALVDPLAVRAKTNLLDEKSNPFSPEVSWLKSAFQKEQFVAFLELVEHEEVLDQNRKKLTDPENCNANLNIKMRVRVFDLRGNEPKVILQEMAQVSHFIPRQFTKENFYQASWGTEAFNISPTGTAHAKFVKDLAKRIDDYILISSQRT
jgi:hypothetical protein